MLLKKGEFDPVELYAETSEWMYYFVAVAFADDAVEEETNLPPHTPLFTPLAPMDPFM